MALDLGIILSDIDRAAQPTTGALEMLREPIAIDGFYATRLIARRAVRFVAILAMVVGATILGTAAVLFTAIDIFLISWGFE